MEVIRVAIADGVIARAPNRVKTTGLGSCVGVVFYDTRRGLCGLVHVMLPNAPITGTDRPTKYADLGIGWLLEQFKQSGSSGQIKAKIAGGAQMFSTHASSDVLRVGPRNVESVVRTLEQLGIPLIAQDTGGNIGRTIEFEPETEKLWVRTAFQGSYTI